MKNSRLHFAQRLLVMSFISLILSCGQGGKEPQKITAAPAVETEKTASLPDTASSPPAAPGAATPSLPHPAQPTAQTALPSAVVAQVDGAKLTRGQLDAELKKSMTVLSSKIPPERVAEATARVRRQIVDDFIVRTLLGKEVKRLKISSTEKEITEALADLKNSLPAGVTMDEMLKKNAMTPELLREEVAMGIRINKLVAAQPASKVKPTDKEVAQFYKTNREKFKTPEAVHARHILLAKVNGEDSSAGAKQKSKAEEIRKQLLAGADFSDLAKKNSDCPSKSNGGDLGSFTKGQMVKPFEDAAFRQKKNEIGPVVETDFGYHIIQVLEHKQPKIKPLDKDAKTRIMAYLQQQKRYEAFNELMKSLKFKANIVLADKMD